MHVLGTARRGCSTVSTGSTPASSDVRVVSSTQVRSNRIRARVCCLDDPSDWVSRSPLTIGYTGTLFITVKSSNVHTTIQYVVTEAFEVDSPAKVDSAQKQLRMLQIHESIAAATLTFARTRVQALVASDDLTPEEQTRILSRVQCDLQQLQDQVTQHTRLIALHDLQQTREELQILFDRTMTGLTTEITAIRTVLRDEKAHPLAGSSHPRAPPPPPPANAAPTPWYQQSKAFLALFLIPLLVVAAPFTYGLLSAQRTVGASGIVASVSLDVFADPAGDTPLTQVEWGVLQPGDTVTQMLYISNTGNQATIVQLDTANWNPSAASQYLTLSWDYDQEAIQPDAMLLVTLSLALTPDVHDIQDFSFDIVLTMQIR